MSLEKEVEIKCPKCGEMQKITLWETLNTNVDPEARKALFKGEINFFTCQQSDEIPGKSLIRVLHEGCNHVV